MTKLLLRLFVKDYKNSAAPDVRASVGRLAGATGIFCNLLLFAIKLTVGILSGAVSIVADALNNFSDASSSIVTLLGFQLARRPADKDHPYGHARYEYVSGLVVAALILVIGVELAGTSVRKIFSPVSIDISGVMLAVLLCSVGLKLWMSLFFSKLGKHIDSSVLKATAADSRNDVIATLAVLAGCVAERQLGVNVDGYVGLAVAVFILVSGVQVARETISPILGHGADPALSQRISSRILSCEKVLGVHDLLVHDYGPGQCFASVHVELSAREDPLVCHDLIDAIESDVLENLQVHLVIHYDPVLDNDEEWAQMRMTMQSIVADIDDRISMHDFRIVRGAEQPKLVFDLAVPYDMANTHKKIRQDIENAMAEQGLAYTAVIRFDDKA